MQPLVSLIFLPSILPFSFCGMIFTLVNVICTHYHLMQHTHTGIVLQVCTIRALSQSELNSVQAHFQSQWVKGECPPITCVFEITNKLLKARWDSYRQKLPSDHQNVEKHYHGTKLQCDIVNAGSPCTDIDCGICGISELGMSRVCIRKKHQLLEVWPWVLFCPKLLKVPRLHSGSPHIPCNAPG